MAQPNHTPHLAETEAALIVLFASWTTLTLISTLALDATNP